MGFANRTETRFLSQGIASLGGLQRVTALYLQFSLPPDSPELPPPSEVQEFVRLFLGLMLLFALVLLVLPEKWSRRTGCDLTAVLLKSAGYLCYPTIASQPSLRVTL